MPQILWRTLSPLAKVSVTACFFGRLDATGLVRMETRCFPGTAVVRLWGMTLLRW